MSAGQISKYKAAVGHRNVGSDPSPQATKNALDTAMGRNRQSNVTSSTVPPTSGHTSASSARGSLEGYMHAPSAPIQINGTGYTSANSMKARYSTRAPADFSGGQSVLLNRSNPARVNDMRMTSSSDSSVSRLHRHMQLNNLF